MPALHDVIWQENGLPQCSACHLLHAMFSVLLPAAAGGCTIRKSLSKPKPNLELHRVLDVPRGAMRMCANIQQAQLS
jgi:hypothetical protein